MDATHRRAARLLVIDPETGSVLLVQYEDGDGRFWATPGGALEGDETFEAAAIREAAEELAVSAATVLPLWRRTVEFSFRGLPVRQEEQYFLLRITPGDVSLGCTVREAHRLEGILAARWWSLEEIETSAERLFPEDLARRLRSTALFT
jgi:8-oxo-dGTP pyrophosphatase MutT (NUDIX family)